MQAHNKFLASLLIAGGLALLYLSSEIKVVAVGTGCPAKVCDVSDPAFNKVAAAAAIATDGDTIKIHGGTADWTGQFVGTVGIAINGNISIVGAGFDQTTIKGPCHSIIFNTVYNKPAGSPPAEVDFSNMTLVNQGNPNCNGLPGGVMVQINGWSQNIRIHHMILEGAAKPATQQANNMFYMGNGYTHGVVDHVVLRNMLNKSYPVFLISNGGWPQGPGNAPNGVTAETGSYAWNHDGKDFWGTANAWYWEDDVAPPDPTGTLPSDTNTTQQSPSRFIGSVENGGGIYVERHCTLSSGNGPHGTDSTGGGTRSIRSIEIYNNYFDEERPKANQEWRGGSGNAFNNRFTHANGSKLGGGGISTIISSNAYIHAGNFGGGQFPMFNSADGTGKFFVNDRSRTNIFTGAGPLPDCQGGTNPNGTGSNNIPCVPIDGYSGTIFAAGQGATVNSGVVTLPGLPLGPTGTLPADTLKGYVVRDPDFSTPFSSGCGCNSRCTAVPPKTCVQSPTQSCDARRYEMIGPHGATSSRSFQLHSDDPIDRMELIFGAWDKNGCDTTSGPGNWELRRVIHAIDAPGSGKSSLVGGTQPRDPTIIGDNGAGVGKWFQRWDYIAQWWNQFRNKTSETWDNSSNKLDADSGGRDYWGPGANQEPTSMTYRGYMNRYRDVGYNNDPTGELRSQFDQSYTYPTFPLTGTQAQKNAVRRIGADAEALAMVIVPSNVVPDHDVNTWKIDYVPPPGVRNNGQATVTNETTYPGYVYPHPLVSGAATGPPSPVITSGNSATFLTGATVACGTTPKTNCFQVTVANFTSGGGVTYSAAVTQVPSGQTAGIMPANVALNGSSGVLSGTATGAGVGDYKMTITAFKSATGETASQPFTLTINGTNAAPTVAITTNGTTFAAPATIIITASPLDSDGSIAKVDFYRGGSTLIGTKSASPWVFTWTGMSAGTYSLTAKATDNLNAVSAASNTVSVTVNAAPTPTPGPIPPANIRVTSVGLPPTTPTPTPTPTPPNSPPTVTTNPATLISSTTARLNGTVNPNGSVTNYQFNRGPNTSYGTNTALTGAGAGTATLPEFADLTGLTSSTTYHFRITATNTGGGTSNGADASFTTTATPTPTPPTPTPSPTPTPVVTTSAATNVTTTSARLNGTINPKGSAATYQFQYGPNITYGSVIPASLTNAGSGNIALAEAADLTGLTSGAAIHYRMTGTNGALVTVNGNDVSFVTATPTPTPPTLGRVAISHDGNEHDHDDILSCSMELALIAKMGYQANVVHYDYGDHFWPSQQHIDFGQLVATSVNDTKAAWGGFTGSAFCSDQTGSTYTLNTTCINHLRDAINASTASDPLTIICAGPMQTVGLALAAASPTPRSFVTVISHSQWNDHHAWDTGRTAPETLTLPVYDWDGTNRAGSTTFQSLGVTKVHIKDQNGDGSGTQMNGQYNTGVPTGYNWLNNTGDPKLQVIWDAGQRANKSNMDCSDAGMVFYWLTGDVNGNPTKVKAILTGP